MTLDDDKTRTHVTLTSGAMVSHYRIMEQIGDGGMGEIALPKEVSRKGEARFTILGQVQWPILARLGRRERAL
jgi:hypothetical protein